MKTRDNERGRDLYKTRKNIPICLMAEITSSIKLGTRSVALVAPNMESEPSRSTSSSKGTPKTPGMFRQQTAQLKLIGTSPFFFTFFLSPLNNFVQNPLFFTSTSSKISSKSKWSFNGDRISTSTAECFMIASCKGDNSEIYGIEFCLGNERLCSRACATSKT